MAKLSPTQIAWRARIETGIRVAQPFLDLLLAAGERVSRVVDRDQLESSAARTSLAPGPGEVTRGR